MRIAIFDLETDGLLDQATTCHILLIRDEHRSRTFHAHLGTMGEGLRELAKYDLIVGHNITKFDLPVLQKLYGFEVPWQKTRDTLVLSRLIWPDLYEKDSKLAAKGILPRRLICSYSLEAWGYRLGCHKADYDGGWEKWSQEMEDYCVQDGETTQKLWDRILKEQYAEESILLETQVAHILSRQERHGFLFDQAKAQALYGTLVQKRIEVERELKTVFKPRYLADGPAFTPKAGNRSNGYTAGAPLTKVRLTEFNPGSRDHIYLWLKAMRGWKPTEFTDNGKPKVDETVLAQLKYPEAALLKTYFLLAKRIGQLAEGNEAWMKRVGKDGRMHGSVNTNGAVTGRMTHSYPNMAQVPAGYSPYGHECRALFCVPPGKKLVGADAAALELRDLAGYMARYDNGAYVEVVLKGDKKAGTDIHSVNARAIGLDPKGEYFDGESGRDIAKTWFYAFIYGAGDAKLGHITTRKKNASKRGKEDRARFMANLPALGTLVDRVKSAAKARGFLKGQDGRRLHVRSEHAALNTLLQSAGAVQMKRALCLLDDALQQQHGLIPGKDYEFVANVHDEWQIEVNDGLEDTVGNAAVEAIRRAGESFGFLCPLDGEWRAGNSWAETH